MTTLDAMAPILPVRSLDAAVAHYSALGFSVTRYSGGGYGYAVWDEAYLHLHQFVDHEPDGSTSAVYLYVSDADALFATWSSAGLGGRLVAPLDTDYGLREGAHVDPDGNLLRFGSWLPGRRPT